MQPSERIGMNSGSGVTHLTAIKLIKGHEFFDGIDFDSIFMTKSPLLQSSPFKRTTKVIPASPGSPVFSHISLDSMI